MEPAAATDCPAFSSPIDKDISKSAVQRAQSVSLSRPDFINASSLVSRSHSVHPTLSQTPVELVLTPLVQSPIDPLPIRYSQIDRTTRSCACSCSCQRELYSNGRVLPSIGQFSLPFHLEPPPPYVINIQEVRTSNQADGEIIEHRIAIERGISLISTEKNTKTTKTQALKFIVTMLTCTFLIYFFASIPHIFLEESE